MSPGVTVCAGCGFEHAAGKSTCVVADPARDEVLRRAQMVRGASSAERLEVRAAGLHALFRLACMDSGRMTVEVMLQVSQPKLRLQLSDVEPLIQGGYVERRGQSMIEITDAGNALVRELLVFVNGKGGVDKP